MAANIGNIFSEIEQYRPAFNTGPYPIFKTSTPGGGSIESGINRSINLQGTGIPRAIRKGILGGNLSEGSRKAITTNPRSVDLSNLNNFLLGKAKAAGKKVNKTPFFNVTPDTDAQSAFDKLQEDYLSQLDEQKAINKQITGALLPSLLGFQNKAIGSASNLVDAGFTELNPFTQEQIKKAQQGFEDEGMLDLNRSLESDLENVSAILADSGIPLGRSSDGGLFLERAALRPFADARARLKAQSQQYGHTLAQDWLGNRRNAFSTLMQSPSFNNSISGLNVPSLPVNPFLMSPTGLYSPEFLLGANQFNSNFGLEKDKIKQGNFNSLIPSAIGLASQPGIGSAIGSIAGNLAGTAGGLGIMKYFFPNAYSGKV